MTSPVQSLDPERIHRFLTRRYVGVLVAVALILGTSLVIIQATLLQREADGRVVNVAGRQRMLSQRVAKSALLVRAGDPGAVADLRADLYQWSTAHEGLLEGSEDDGLPGLDPSETRDALLQLTTDIEHVSTEATVLVNAMAASDEPLADRAVGQILGGTRVFLVGMEPVVFALSVEAGGAILHLRAIAIAFLFLGLAVLAAIGRYGLRPTTAVAVQAVRQAADQSRLLKTVVDTIPDHIYVKDTEGRATLRNAASARAVSATDPESSLGQTDVELAVASGGPPETVELAKAALADDLSVITGGPAILNREEKSADGGWLLTTKVPLLDDQGRLVGLVGVSRDVTDQKATEAMFRGLVEHSVAGTIVIQDDRLVYANPRMAEIFGYEPGEMAGLPFLDLVHEDDRAVVEETVRQRGEAGVDVLSYNVRGCTKNGETLYVEVSEVVGEYDGSPAVVGTAIDMTEQQEIEQTLYHQAHHDELTGLPNRALFTGRLDVAVEAGDDFAVLYIDLDRFKAVNDTLGHSAGDRLLQKVARRLEQTVRAGDTVARLGGDEFAVLLVGDRGLEHAGAVADRIQQVLSRPVRLDGHALHVGASVGLVKGRPDHESADTVLGEADHAMYSVKREGRGHWASFDVADRHEVSEQLRLERDLPGAVERGELRLVYQPLVRLDDGGLVGFEALVRWFHPEFGLLAPAAFIGLAEENGQIAAIDRWVLAEAARQMNAWRAALPDRPPSLSVNCTGRDLLDPQFVRSIADALGPCVTPDAADKQGQGCWLTLEITEGLLVEEQARVAAELSRLQGQGVQFALDDFGTGYASLSTLHALPVDAIKIDRSFVSDVDVEDESQKLVETIVQLGRLLEKSVVAEGIETPAHLGALRSMGCPYGQGYLFAKPISADDATALLDADALPWDSLWEDLAEAA